MQAAVNDLLVSTVINYFPSVKVNTLLALDYLNNKKRDKKERCVDNGKRLCSIFVALSINRNQIT